MGTHESRHSTHRHVSKMSKDSEYIPRPNAKLVKKELIAESKRAAKDAAKAEAIDFLRETLPNDFEETAKAWRETDKRVLERGPLLGKVGMTLTVTKYVILFCVITALAIYYSGKEMRFAGTFSPQGSLEAYKAK